MSVTIPAGATVQFAGFDWWRFEYVVIYTDARGETHRIPVDPNSSTEDDMNLEEIKGRAAAATPGPWDWVEADSEDEKSDWQEAAVVQASATGCHSLVWKNADAEFIAHARQDVPALVAHVERLRHLLAEVAPDYCTCAEYEGETCLKCQIEAEGIEVG